MNSTSADADTATFLGVAIRALALVMNVPGSNPGIDKKKSVGSIDFNHFTFSKVQLTEQNNEKRFISGIFQPSVGTYVLAMENDARDFSAVRS